MNNEKLHQLLAAHSQVTIDSRDVPAGSLFVAIRGERFDGNDFAADALAKGAAYAIVDRPEAAAADKRCLLVDDGLQTLQELARHHRRQFAIPVLAIGGSNGKTTTKELIAAVLGSHYPLHYTRGNFNNHIGLPLTLLAMPLTIEVAVLELGANAPGETAALCRIAEPTHGLVTNVGKDHLEGFGGEEGVRRANAELYEYLASRDGVAFVNMDEAYLADLARTVRKRLPYGQSTDIAREEDPYRVQLLGIQPFVSAAFIDEKGRRQRVESQLIGRYNFSNIMTAVVVGRYFKVPGDKIRRAIEQYQPSNNRSQLLQRGSNTFILDAYNANPSSMVGAIDHFAEWRAAHKVAILGHMLELGDYSRSEHERIARYARARPFDEVVLVGEQFEEIAGQLGLRYFPDARPLRAWLRESAFEQTSFLLKGSRGIRLEEALRED